MDPQSPSAPTPQQSVQAVPPPPEAKKDSHWITILAMALFVLSSFGVIIFLYYQNQALKKMLANYQAQTTPTPTATPDPTANWKTYTNQKYGYSIKFPSSWNVNSVAFNLNSIEPGHCYNEDEYPEFIEISSQKNRSSCSGVDYIASDQAEIIILALDKEGEAAYEYFFNGPTKINVAGEVATRKIFDKNTERPAPMATTIAFRHKGQAYIIYVQQPAEGVMYNDFFDQILSTFKFLEDEEVVGIQTNQCCPCPTKISASQIGKEGWMEYQEGKDYSIYLPKSCSGVQCAPCPPQSAN